MSKKVTEVHLPSAKQMAAALAEVRAIQPKHDARLMLLVFLDRAGLIGSQLKAMKLETDESLKSLFDAALERAKKDRPVPTMTTPGGITGSKVLS